MAAAIISAAPVRSILWARSWTGTSFSCRLDNSAAAKASGTLSQKITDQCRCSAMTPPSTGPAAPATIQTEPV